MNQEIEIEYKMLLTEIEFNALLRELPFPIEAVSQTNHYFETKEFMLKENRSALRIREKNNTYTLTLKEPHDEGILETHDSLTEHGALDWMKGHPNPTKNVSHQLNRMNIPVENLKYFGSLTTERHQFEQDNIIYVLDKSTYNNMVDYELEIESPTKETGLLAFRKILDDFSIEEKQTKTKIERFFSTLT